MYNSPGRRGGSPWLADARARRVPADFHEGSYRDFLRRHERESADAARRTGRKRSEFAGCLFRRAADSRNLRCAIDYLASEGGSAPGPNGLTLDELDGSERWELARALGASIRTGRYRPGPHREVRISKGAGRGLRTLRIRNVEDRVVERAIVQVIQPFLDPTFSAASFGYRPGRGREHALAYAEAIADTTGAWVWVLDDVRDAFDNVALRRLLDVVRKRLVAEDIVGLIQIVIDGDATRGIGQGSSLSPLLLYLLLDHLLDRPWAKRQPATPLIRVADDLLVLARDGTAARQSHEYLKAQLRAAGMELKAAPQAAVRDLQHGETGDWLGFRLCKGPGGLEVRPTERCWAKLDEALGLAHTKPAAPARALETIGGWTEQLGPCRPHLDSADFYARIVSVTHRYAFDEIPSRHILEDRLLRGHRRWGLLRRRARLHRMEQVTAAPPARV
jgi:Reverse transcriptase (RNA-dependent DNA polymerase)